MRKESEVQSLETYLAQIERELRDLPVTARADEMREIEAHLRAMIESRGDVAGVLAQFGLPRKVGRDLQRAWERKQPESWWRAILAPSAALMYFALDTLLYNRLYDAINNYFSDILRRPWSPIMYLIMYLSFALWMLATFFFTGFIAGAISPKRGVWLTLVYCVYSVYSLSLLASAPKQANALSWSVTQVVCLLLLLNFACPLTALAGNYFGARRGRRVSARIENGGRKVFAHIATGRKALARIAGDSKLNVQL